MVKAAYDEVFEATVIPLWPPKHLFHVLRSRPLLRNARRVVLPIVLPRFRLRFMRQLNQWIQNRLGRLLGRILRPDIVLGETHTAWPVASGASETSQGSTLLMDIHGAVPEEIRYSYPSTPWHRGNAELMDQIERQIVMRSNLVICQSHGMVTHLTRKHNHPSARMAVFRCGVDVQRFTFDSVARVRIRESIGVFTDEVPVFIYSGSLARWQRLEHTLQLVRAFSERNCSDTRMIILTAERKESALALLLSSGLKKDQVHVFSVDNAAVPQYLSAADVAFLLRDDTLLNRVASPTKLGEYLACGLPVVTSPVAQYWLSPEEISDCTCIVRSDGQLQACEDLASFVERIKADPEMCRSRCREMACSYHARDIDAQGLHSAVQGCLSSTKTTA